MKPRKLCKVYSVAFCCCCLFLFFSPFLRPPLNFCFLDEDLGNAAADSTFPEQRALLLLMRLSNMKQILPCIEWQTDIHVDEANAAVLKIYFSYAEISHVSPSAKFNILRKLQVLRCCLPERRHYR